MPWIILYVVMRNDENNAGCPLQFDMNFYSVRVHISSDSSDPWYVHQASNCICTRASS